jgi:hypothetical protein
MVTAAVAIAIDSELVRRSRQSDKPEINALRASNAGSFQMRVQMYWVTSAAPTIAPACAPPTSKSRPNRPYTSSAASSAIW